MKLIQKLIYQGLNELEWKYHNSSCKTYADRLPTIDKVMREVQDHPHALFLTDKQLNAVQVAIDFMTWIEGLEVNLPEDSNHGEDELAQAESVKRKIERLFNND